MKNKTKKLTIPKPPLDRVTNQSHGHCCPECKSTMHRGILGLFGKLICDNPNCSKNK